MDDIQSKDELESANGSDLSDEQIEAVQRSNPQEIREFLVARSEMHSGPIPSPSDMAEYAKVDASFPERIMRMSEDQGKHRREIEKQLTEHEIIRGNEELKIEKLGLIFGFGVSSLCLIVGVALLAYGKNVAGFSSLISSVALLLGSFFHSMKEKDKRADEENIK
ncbi:MAG: DUF2335 domain-containing protein [Peptoniphilaceae bacterium]|nr:DUF2335 domain-containing protein [Peptoniphilaceae bacterium]